MGLQRAAGRYGSLSIGSTIRGLSGWSANGWRRGFQEGRKIETAEGTPQGAVISPLLANVYLHYVYDLWVRQWRQRQSTGEMIVVRYADDTIVGFERQDDAKRLLFEDLSAHMADFGLGSIPKRRGSSSLRLRGEQSIEDVPRRAFGASGVASGGARPPALSSED